MSARLSRGLLALLLLWAGALELGLATRQLGPERVFDERYVLRNVRTAVLWHSWRPDNAYYPGLSWMPVAALVWTSDQLAELTSTPRLRPFWKTSWTPMAFLLGRLVSVACAIVALVLLYLLGAKLFDPAVGLLAALLLSGTFLFQRLGSIMKPEALLVATSLLGVWLAVRAWERPGARSFAVAGLGLGLAVASKYNGAALAASLVVLAILLFRGGQRRAFTWLAVGLLVAGAVFVLFDPWALFAPGVLTHALRSDSTRYRVTWNPLAMLRHWRQIPFFMDLVTSYFGHGPVFGVLALLGIPWLGWEAFRRRASDLRRHGLQVALSFVVAFGVATAALSPRRDPHNWFAVLPWTALGAAILLIGGWRFLEGRWPKLRHRAIEIAVAALVVLAVAGPATARAVTVFAELDRGDAGKGASGRKRSKAPDRSRDYSSRWSQPTWGSS